MLKRARWRGALAATMIAASLLGPAIAPARADETFTARPGWRHFVEAGHVVAEPFLSFYDRYGALSSFGHPISAAFEADGRLVQYFQRARFEHWPENPVEARVQLSNLGDLFGVGAEPPTSLELLPPSAVYFAETGHTVAGDFLDFIGERGGVSVFGYPTTEPFLDNGRLTQQFQRAILEFWPENPVEARVQPRLLGEQFAGQRGLPEAARAPRTGAVEPIKTWTVWGAAEESAVGYLDEKVRNVARSFEWLDGKVLEPGERLAFSRVLDIGGYELGLCYTAGGEYFWCEAGGACSGAGVFYRAWTNAGLDVVYRQAHTVMPGNPQLYGRDVAIYEGLIEFVVRNTTNSRIKINAKVDHAKPSFIVHIEADQPPPWTVQVVGPIQEGPLSFKVNYQKLHADGRVEDNWVSTRYFSPPPTYIPPKPY